MMAASFVMLNMRMAAKGTEWEYSYTARRADRMQDDSETRPSPEQTNDDDLKPTVRIASRGIGRH